MEGMVDTPGAVEAAAADKIRYQAEMVEKGLEARCEYGLGKCQWSGFIRASSR